MDPLVKLYEIVASTDVEKPTAPIIFQIDHCVCQSLPRYGLEVAVNCVDAHSSNWLALLADSTHSASDILPASLMEKLSKVDFSVRHIRRDPLTNQPVVNSPNPCHLLKNIVFTLEKSWKPQHKRNLFYKKCPVNMGMSYDSWIATGGGSNQLQPTKLTSSHFFEDPNSRMDVLLSAQLLSASVGGMI